MDKKAQHRKPNSESPDEIDHIGHILVASYPLQGHASTVVKMANIYQFGVKVTFLITEFTPTKMASSMPISKQDGKMIKFALVPDGLEPDDDRNDQPKLARSIHKLMPVYLEDFIRKTNVSSNAYDRFTSFIVDAAFTYLLEVPKKMGIKYVTCWADTPGALALGLHDEKLIEAK